MANQSVPQLPAENRYLNLAGAPWSPEKRNRPLSSTMIYAPLGASLILALTTYFTDVASPGRTTLNLGAGLLGAAISTKTAVRMRRNEAEMVGGTKVHTLVIDKSPSPGEKTDPAILEETRYLADMYTRHKASEIALLGTGGFMAATASTFGQLFTLTQASYTFGTTASMICSWIGGGSHQSGWAGYERRRQFEHIASGKWVIKDCSDAISHFQKEELEELMSQQNYTLRPIPIDRPGSKPLPSMASEPI